jgi:hypothetical protein
VEGEVMRSAGKVVVVFEGVAKLGVAVHLEKLRASAERVIRNCVSKGQMDSME